ncbi:MAG: nucleotidyl transferase AbiEii/AbiGii toxin family protein [Deltaproteobacteria bacterium]|nr:nucleotidyl transferase AbiEii/AbiGii toxin family protein [Deltaproteobacteria bacterium]
MNRILPINSKERGAYFETAAARMGVPAQIIEKDFWVVWVLGRLFDQTAIKPHLTFKGGTSLAKVFGLIKRFSEDIDLSIEKSFFGLADSQSPEQAPSRKKRQERLDKLSRECAQCVRGPMLTGLKKDFSQHLLSASDWKLIPDKGDPTGQTLLFEYPTDFPKKAGYVRSAVKIEMGARSEHWPVSQKKIQSYLKEALEENIDEPEVIVRVLNVERTFWEKATILHQYAHIPRDKMFPLRLSRHYYDFYCLIHSTAKDGAMKEQNLLARVARHKEIYFPSAWADYASAKKGSLKLIPQEHFLRALRQDYQLMRDMFFEEPPAWDDVVKSIGAFEREFNHE